MVTKRNKSTSAKKVDAPLTDSVRDSAQQIWQAGLGAFNSAQREGSKAFEALVKEGTSLQRKTQAAAEEKIAQAASKMSALTSDISSRAAGQWDKLEAIFESRVAKALTHLGVPSAQEFKALIERIDELNQSVQKLAAAKTKPATKAATTKATKPAARSTAPRKPV